MIATFLGCVPQDVTSVPFLNSSSNSSTSSSFSLTAPVVYSISPSIGSSAGGAVVSIFGQNFASTSQVTVGGASCVASSSSSIPFLISSSFIQCVTSQQSAGTGSVVVTNADAQTSTLASSYTAVSPSITSLSPSSGTTTGGSLVTVLGNYFSPGATVTLAGINCTDVNVLSPNSLQCTSGSSSGSTLSGAVVVTNADGAFASLTGNAFSYQLPVVNSVSPLYGPNTGGTVITILGSGLVPNASLVTQVTLTSGSATATCGSVTVNSSTQLQCTTPSAALLTPSSGAFTITVTNPDGQTASGVSFNYVVSTAGGVFAYSQSTVGLKVGGTVSLTSSITPVGSYIYAMDSTTPSLPSGLSLNSTTGTISGTPLVSKARSAYLVNATQVGCSGSSCTLTATINISVYDFGNSTTSTNTLTGTVNNYAYVTNNIPAAANAFSVDSGAAFSSGDRILVIQMQSPTTPTGNLNTWEFATINQVMGTLITLTRPLSNAYASGTLNSTAARVTQIVKVPEYQDVTVSGTVTGTAWNPVTGKGGVIALRANGTVTLNANIDASGIGFTGGASAAGSDTTVTAYSGESWSGLGIASTNANNGGGGGAYASYDAFGAFNFSRASGGGGGYGAVGNTTLPNDIGDSGTPGSGGSIIYAVGDLLPNFNLLLGSGGGGAADTQASCTPPSGAKGGGIVFLMVNDLVLNGHSILSVGATGTQDPVCFGVGGSGAGGSVYVIANQISATTGFNLSGGPSFSANGMQGGSGGAGAVRVDCTAIGGTNSSNVVYGGTDCSGHAFDGVGPTAGVRYLTNL